MAVKGDASARWTADCAAALRAVGWSGEDPPTDRGAWAFVGQTDPDLVVADGGGGGGAGEDAAPGAWVVAGEHPSMPSFPVHASRAGRGVAGGGGRVRQLEGRPRNQKEEKPLSDAAYLRGLLAMGHKAEDDREHGEDDRDGPPLLYRIIDNNKEDEGGRARASPTGSLMLTNADAEMEKYLASKFSLRKARFDILRRFRKLWSGGDSHGHNPHGHNPTHSHNPHGHTPRGRGPDDGFRGHGHGPHAHGPRKFSTIVCASLAFDC